MCLAQNGASQAYTAVVRKPNKTLIGNSLFRKIKELLWCTEQLPPKPNGITLTANTQHLTTMIKGKAKHTQENLDTAGSPFLFNNPGQLVTVYADNVLCQIVQVGKGESELKSPKIIWHNTDMLSRTQFAYLFSNYYEDKATSTIWTEVDNQLGYLVSKGCPYTVCFYNLIYKRDCGKFDSGSVIYDNIPRAKRSFTLPLND
ncbi:uncharacterized protein MELLADRAFT_63672 [Melampsora larici-populina 98AG31]|uniref:Uncharacterized protein n=1 Tax=Melampsora larici-populina (strain 98AG31 / pathotype 3-4-7) TaxID=747676 RepID=F4RNJ8_MELLP|nr:uncharacterized protein MELLADRAFT_63672 [Melampsora larici-populina 98AG31]EGG06083.1 hypothetical protein MELLADRAFT_63672 [Melampsora larici-populina 98AG31]